MAFGLFNVIGMPVCIRRTVGIALGVWCELASVLYNIRVTVGVIYVEMTAWNRG